MGIKHILKQILPPIVVSLINKYRYKKRQPDSSVEWEYMPRGWNTQNIKIKGWNHESVVAVQKENWTSFLHNLTDTQPLDFTPEAEIRRPENFVVHNTLMSFAYILALASRKKDRLSILDWGGGTGYYYLISQALLPEININYHCYDLPLLCKHGRQLLPEVTFHETEESVLQQRYDLVLSSSSLQYFKEWQDKVRIMTRVSTDILYLTRLPTVFNTASFVVVQRPYCYGYDTEYLGWFLNRQDIIKCVEDNGMRLIREFLVDEKPPVKGAPENGEYRGFLFRHASKKALNDK